VARKTIVKACRSGVDAMIAVFSDFLQFSAEKIGVYLEKQCYDQSLAKTSTILGKKPTNFFDKFFRRKYFF
jgi:hypothetical protein